MLELLDDWLWSQAPIIALIGLGALFWLLLAALALLLRRYVPGQRDRQAPRATRPDAAYQPPANALQHR
ncbi:hypothetical protein [Pseudomonas zhanjiangensis]|uniref:Uncharacterized protein n=1 Tax=Pseudomonas zhanjiangensis TaxID=3239015 RepID=A0ABV3YQ29_9PSED